MGWDAELRILLTPCLYTGQVHSLGPRFIVKLAPTILYDYRQPNYRRSVSNACDFVFTRFTSQQPQDDPHQRFIPFDEFLEGVKGATFAQWNHTAVESGDAFNVMKNHILTMYDGIGTISQSFVLDVEYGDCVDVLKQPTLRILGLDHIESEPLNSSFPSLSEGRGEKFEFVESRLKLDLKDRFGNCISCPERTIPFARLTLEKLTAFKTLDDFFAKSEDGSGFASVSRDVPSRRSLVRRDDEAHLHAVGDQWVTNYGGNSWLELWNPVGDFTLSQRVYGRIREQHSIGRGWLDRLSPEIQYEQSGSFHLLYC